MNKLNVILGPAGTGKSTLINQLTGKSNANVSHDAHRDGTDVCQIIENFVDTPGLDSENVKFDSFVNQLKELGEEGQQFSLFLVLNCPRVQLFSTMEAFEQYRFYIIWVIDPEAETEESWRQKCPEALLGQYKTKDIQQLIAQIDAGQCVRLKINSPPVSTSTQKPIDKTSILRCRFAFVLKLLHECPSRPDLLKPKFKVCLQQFYEKVKVCKDERSEEYLKLKVLGDAFLRTFAYAELYLSDREISDYDSDTQNILGNGVGQFMAKFYDHNIASCIAAPTGELNGHSKADFVEAMIASAFTEQLGRNVDILQFFILSMKKFIETDGAEVNIY
jgi:GTPase SAR1 family protein